MLALTILSMSFANVQAVKPLEATTDVQFNLGYPGPQDQIPDWVGHLYVDGMEYGIIFYNVGTGKPFTTQNGGQTVFFKEEWIVFASIDYQFDSQGVLQPDWSAGPILMSGNDQGVVSLANSAFRMNGLVQYATGPFQNYQDLSVHMSGIVQWYPSGAPHYALNGNFRIN